jgi:hypothetical protein
VNRIRVEKGDLLMLRRALTTIPSLATIGVVLFGPANASAGPPVSLSDRQLDGVTAGSALVDGVATAQATGLITIAGTQSNSAIGSNQSVEEGFGSYGGVTVGSANAFGLNGNAGSSTDVATDGAAQGNVVLNMSSGGKFTSGSFTYQAGYTAVYGVFVPGL